MVFEVVFYVGMVILFAWLIPASLKEWRISRQQSRNLWATVKSCAASLKHQQREVDEVGSRVRTLIQEIESGLK